MNRLRPNWLFFYCVALAATHGLAIAIFYREYSAGGVSDPAFGLWLLVIAPVAFAVKIKTWWHFGVFVLLTLAIWQISPWVMDWALGRLSEPTWWEDRTGTWPGEILRRSLYPIILASGGALLGRLPNSPRLH